MARSAASIACWGSSVPENAWMPKAADTAIVKSPQRSGVLPIALASAGWISALLFGLTPVDPLSLAFSILILLFFSALAGYIPARKASQVDPMVALRYE